MSNNFKPMLAGKAPEPEAVRYPVRVSHKLDGVRAVVRGGRVLSRNLLELPCPTVQELFGDPRFDGFDGELIVGDPTAPDAFRRTSSLVTARAHLIGEAREQLTFHVFDDWAHDGHFQHRFDNLSKRILKAAKQLKVVPHLHVVNHHALELYEELAVDHGYEGIMLRDPLGRYKHGRSTTKEGLLLKLKRFEDAEALVLECKELQHNENEVRTGGLAQRRSSKKLGMVGGAMLGAFHVMGLNGKYKGVKFDVGTGFKQAERQAFWESQAGLRGKVINYRYFPLGSKDKPRFPTFRGFRHRADM